MERRDSPRAGHRRISRPVATINKSTAKTLVLGGSGPDRLGIIRLGLWSAVAEQGLMKRFRAVIRSVTSELTPVPPGPLLSLMGHRKGRDGGWSWRPPPPAPPGHRPPQPPRSLVVLLVAGASLLLMGSAVLFATGVIDLGGDDSSVSLLATASPSPDRPAATRPGKATPIATPVPVPTAPPPTPPPAVRAVSGESPGRPGSSTPPLPPGPAPSPRPPTAPPVTPALPPRPAATPAPTAAPTPSPTPSSVASAAKEPNPNACEHSQAPQHAGDSARAHASSRSAVHCGSNTD